MRRHNFDLKRKSKENSSALAPDGPCTRWDGAEAPPGRPASASASASSSRALRTPGSAAARLRLRARPGPNALEQPPRRSGPTSPRPRRDQTPGTRPPGRGGDSRPPWRPVPAAPGPAERARRHPRPHVPAGRKSRRRHGTGPAPALPPTAPGTSACAPEVPSGPGLAALEALCACADCGPVAARRLLQDLLPACLPAAAPPPSTGSGPAQPPAVLGPRGGVAACPGRWRCCGAWSWRGRSGAFLTWFPFP